MVEVIRATKLRAASAKWQGISQTETIQWLRATCAEKSSAAMQKCVKKLMAEKGRLTVGCEDLEPCKQCVYGPFEPTRRMFKLCVEVQCLDEEHTKGVSSGRPVRANLQVGKLNAFLAKALD